MLLASTLLAQAVLESKRLGRASFDLELWCALLLTSFWDSVTNIVQPIWFYSANFVNLNEWWGHAPGFVSPAGVWSTTVCALRFFVNDRGESFAERGLEHLSAPKQALISTMAMTAWCSLAVIVYSSLATLTGFYSSPYPKDYPEHLPNVVCDIPGSPTTQGSEYGPCPGSPGFTIPLE